MPAMKISESMLLDALDSASSVYLLEPNYRRKYVPAGLAKISTYLKHRGTPVDFGREYSGGNHDLVCITSLFTSQAAKVLEAYDRVRFFAPDSKIIIGGIYASLMPGHAAKEMPGAELFIGYSKTLDLEIPDYDTDWGVKPPWDQASITFTSRGCSNNCPYCAVPRLEPGFWINPSWESHIVADRPIAMISDNNLSSAPWRHLSDVIAFLKDGNKKVIFDNGFDCKLITTKLASRLADLKYTRRGMRLAFDRIEEDAVFSRRSVG